MKQALSWIKQKNWPIVEVESDCLAVVQAIRSSVPMLSNFGQIIKDFRRDIRQLSKVSLYFIKWSANMVVHQFAKASYEFPDRVFHRCDVPIDFNDCIMSELVLE